MATTWITVRRRPVNGSVRLLLVAEPMMRSHSRLSKHESAVQDARADYMVNAVRQNLPPSSLWHEKLFSSPSQIENLAITTMSGSLSISTYDTKHSSYLAIASITEFGNLGLLVQHVPSANSLLSSSAINEILTVSNTEFDWLVEFKPDEVVNCYRRLTCVMDFPSPDTDVNSHGERLFKIVAKELDLPLQYEPFNFAKANGLDNVADTEWLEGAARAADFLIDQPLDERAIFDLLKRLDLRDQKFNPRRVWATVPRHREIHNLQIVARTF